jgi:hypothetical protein
LSRSDWFSSVLSASTCRRRSSTSCRRAVFSGSHVTLLSDGWGAASMMRSTQRPAVSKSTSGCPARIALILEGSQLAQMLQRKPSGKPGARLLRCIRNCDGLRSPNSSSVRRSRMRCSLEGDSRSTNSILSVV